MISKYDNPTKELYQQLQLAYEHFNQHLFDGKLPNVLITIQKNKGVRSYLTPMSWGSSDGKVTHELILNSSFISSTSFMDFFLMLAHEQCHVWQITYGTPSRPSYHNKEWANKMISLGVAPSHTGKPGGNTTGQKILEYAEKDGKFENAAKVLVDKGFHVSWFELLKRTPLTRNVGQHAAHNMSNLNKVLGLPMVGKNKLICKSVKVESKTKIKYSCPQCNTNVWGKTGLRIRCEECEKQLIIAT